MHSIRMVVRPIDGDEDCVDGADDSNCSSEARRQYDPDNPSAVPKEVWCDKRTNNSYEGVKCFELSCSEVR